MAYTWTTCSSLPAARRVSTIGIINGWLYCAGGYAGATSGTITAVTYKAQIQSNGSLGAWSTTANIQNMSHIDTFRAGNWSAAANGYLFSLAGSNNIGNGVGYAYVQQLSSVTGELNAGWTFPTGSGPAGMSSVGMGLILDGSSLWRTGGFATNPYNRTIYAAWVGDTIYSEAGTMPSGRRFHTMVKNGNYHYVIGGEKYVGTGTSFGMSNEVLVATPGGSWSDYTTTTPLPENSYCGGAYSINGTLFVVVGATSTSNAYSSNVYRATLGANGTVTAWTFDSSIGESRNNFGMPVVYNGRAYIVGGESSTTTGTTTVTCSNIYPPRAPITSLRPLGFNDGIGY